MAKPLTLQPITTSAAWRGDELGRGGDWIYLLDDVQLAELEAAGAQLIADNPDLRRVEPGDYPLESLQEAVAQWKERLDVGHGFVLVRGLRTQLYSDALSAAIYYLLGLLMGEPMRQNELGDLIDHIYATSDKTLDDPTALSKSIRDKLPFHSDSSDVVSLMCLRPSKAGGASCLVSGAQIYNEILARRPDLAPLLFEPFHWDWRRQDPDAPANTYCSPIISLVDGTFSMYAGSLYILTAQDFPEVPRLTEAQRELLELFEAITYEPGMAIEMDFRPGDIQWLSNHAALHSRTEFIDYPEPQRRRHLMRLWLRRREPRAVTPGFGKSVVQNRTTHRDAGADDSKGNFHIVEAAVPRVMP
ncbi:TauD/TfdA family dioxygenase [Pseudomonas lopnurensis]|uniref:TauD/TfdA family dioxygenase n=1 Tax=Pseudomonas lopnurensis TaxID=1477517 RepID=UPI00187AD317|nr:TauD/TfdA family dioxygenase [Pseudomonas lopnurensis]MBE7375699.1 TauD/TfdA family dioxygenase [Pseudomonas lopnurensis]